MNSTTNISIVIYKHSPEDIRALVNQLHKNKLTHNIFIIDNSPISDIKFQELPVTYIFSGKNLGYGKANNIALKQSLNDRIPYHFVVNPDILCKSKTITDAISIMEQDPKIGMLMPKITNKKGEIQYLCKLLPSPIDLLARRFLPARWNKKRNERFELRTANYKKRMEVPYLSGCFICLRTEAIEKVGLFDERFFMYPEDIDLSRRMQGIYKTVFDPTIQVTHIHQKASYSSFKMLAVHLYNMAKYFNKWGWIFDKERNLINKKTLHNISHEL